MHRILVAELLALHISVAVALEVRLELIAHKEGLDPITAARSFDGNAWAHLRNAVELMPGNASRAYLEVERE